MKKTINISAVTSTLRGESVFFPTKQHVPAPDQAGEPQENHRMEQAFLPQPPSEEHRQETTVSRHHDTIIPSNHDTMVPLPEPDDLLEAVRKAVKHIGKEAATQRLTLEEKQALAEIEYTYKRQGIKTSGNEIMRIATNYIVRDYQKNGVHSILDTIIKRLNA